jgi:hypothetical protein
MSSKMWKFEEQLNPHSSMKNNQPSVFQIVKIKGLFLVLYSLLSGCLLGKCSATDFYTQPLNAI